MSTNMTLERGSKYQAGTLHLVGWTAGDGTGAEGYHMEDYFAADGAYLGPDAHGIEPVFAEIINSFAPTHVITLDNGEHIQVQLVDGAAYTRAEWDATDQADYERQDDGSWTFQGSPFAGTVETLRSQHK